MDQPDDRPRSSVTRPRWLSALILVAWVLPALFILALAILQLRTGHGAAGDVSVASYAAQAQIVASPAPDFRVPDVGGAGDRTLSELRGHVVVLNFWASWCSPCRAEAPDLERTYKAYRHRGVEFLGIDERDDLGGAGSFMREFGITYPSGFDPSGQLAFDYDLIGLPTTVVVDRDGQAAYRFTGIVTADALGSALDGVLKKKVE
jgi:thiol-disulfide isomerase/thioredoxin